MCRMRAVLAGRMRIRNLITLLHWLREALLGAANYGRSIIIAMP